MASAAEFLPSEPAKVELRPGERASPIEISLEHGAVLWGKVSTSAGEAVPGARVAADDATGLSDAEGAYRLTGVAQGEQRVGVRHPSYRRVARSVEIEPGDNRLDLEIEPGVAVEGRVIQPGGDPVAGAEVRLRTEDRRDRWEYRAPSDTAGRFRLATVAAGRFRLSATALDGSSGELPGPVVVGRDSVHGLEVEITLGARLSGRGPRLERR